MICNKEGQPEPNQLMECSACWEIVHVPCLQQKYENLNSKGVVNEDIEQRWKCPKCSHDATKGQFQVSYAVIHIGTGLGTFEELYKN